MQQSNGKKWLNCLTFLEQWADQPFPWELNPPSMKAFIKKTWRRRSRNKIKDVGEWKWRTKFLLFWRPASRQTPSGHHSAVYCEGDRWQVDEHHPPIQSSKSSNSPSGHQEWCICQLSSSLKSHSPKKDPTSFLPGVVQQPGFRRKTFWCSSHTPLVIHISTGMLLMLRAAWDVALARLNAKDIFTDARIFKNNHRTFMGCQSNTWTYDMWV